ncbi:MAG: hypothetical protein KDA96_28535, partial [Planctomycetaceae bacterium]|nr:hypothetical protein [Planctomycetaceae bacterium]
VRTSFRVKRATGPPLASLDPPRGRVTGIHNSGAIGAEPGTRFPRKVGGPGRDVRRSLLFDL